MGCRVVNPARLCRFLCSVTSALCEQVPFAALTPCGHAFSDRAIRQVMPAPGFQTLLLAADTDVVIQMQHIGLMSTVHGSRLQCVVSISPATACSFEK